jgi:hypothetical protein
MKISQNLNMFSQIPEKTLNLIITQFKLRNFVSISVTDKFFLETLSSRTHWQRLLERDYPNSDVINEDFQETYKFYHMLSEIAHTLSYSKELADSYSLIHRPCERAKPVKITPKLLEIFNMEKLDLSFKKPEFPYTSYWHEIKTIPRALCMLDKLTEINLANNDIEEIPKEFGQLINLISLYLNKNQIRKIPKEIGNLSKLEILDLSDNRLVAFPKEIVNLTKLRVLNLLEGNPDVILTDEFCDFYEMRGSELSFH